MKIAERVYNAASEQLNKTLVNDSQSFKIGFYFGVDWAYNHPVWRKCEDELPSENEYVLVVLNGNPPIFNVCYYSKENKGWHTVTDFFNSYEVIAWLPLPKFNQKAEKG